MPKYYYTQTVTYTLVVEADTGEAADATAAMTDVGSASVMSMSTGWEEDGITFTDED